MELLEGRARCEVHEHPSTTEIDPNRHLVWKELDGSRRPFAGRVSWLVGRGFRRSYRVYAGDCVTVGTW